ncbi:MAG: sensor histidine kinase [Candidatus Binatia bacterium]
MQHTMTSAEIPSAAPTSYSQPRTAASYERELERYRLAERDLREIIAVDEKLLRQKDETIQNQALLSSESDHRILNDLQMIVSVLSLQSRASENAEAASQLATAADRIVAIARIHRRLHSLDGATTVAFKKFLEDLSTDFSSMVSSPESGEREIVVEGEEIELPTVTCRPLGFIANELITNAAKYGKGRITVRLEHNLEKGYALSVSNDGPALPQGFDPAASKGLGMKIVQSFVRRIGGELRITQDENGKGPRFMVLFS